MRYMYAFALCIQLAQTQMLSWNELGKKNQTPTNFVAKKTKVCANLRKNWIIRKCWNMLKIELADWGTNRETFNWLYWFNQFCFYFEPNYAPVTKIFKHTPYVPGLQCDGSTNCRIRLKWSWIISNRGIDTCYVLHEQPTRSRTRFEKCVIALTIIWQQWHWI